MVDADGTTVVYPDLGSGLAGRRPDAVVPRSTGPRAAGCVAEHAPSARVLVAYLVGGASLCAVRDGRSVATTMGFTPLDGLVMGTESDDPVRDLKAAGATVRTLVIHAREDLEMDRQARRLLHDADGWPP